MYRNGKWDRGNCRYNTFVFKLPTQVCTRWIFSGEIYKFDWFTTDVITRAVLFWKLTIYIFTNYVNSDEKKVLIEFRIGKWNFIVFYCWELSDETYHLKISRSSREEKKKRYRIISFRHFPSDVSLFSIYFLMHFIVFLNICRGKYKFILKWFKLFVRNLITLPLSLT